MTLYLVDPVGFLYTEFCQKAIRFLAPNLPANYKSEFIGGDRMLSETKLSQGLSREFFSAFLVTG